MATANPLEDILNSDVDPNAISALVGSLESQLASPTIKDSSQINSASAVPRNHVQTQQAGSSLANAKFTQASSLDLKTGVLQSNIQNSHSSANGNNVPNSRQQVMSVANQVTASVSVISVSTCPARSVSVCAALTHSNATTNMQFNSNNPFVNKQGNATSIVSSAGTVIRTTQNGGVLQNNVQSTLNDVSSDSTSAIYNLASVAAEQKPLSITTSNPSGYLMTSTEQKQARPQQVINIVNNPGNTQLQKPQFVIKQDQGVKPDVTVSATPQNVVHSAASITLKSNTSGSGNVITITKPMSNPHTVTVVRPPVNSQATSAQQIVVNVPPNSNAVNPRLQGVGTNPRTLAPRMVQGPQVRIAPQQQTQSAHTLASQPRQQGNVQGTITLPPGFQLPPGAMIVKNDQGQYMVVNPGAGNMATASTAQARAITQVVRPSMSTVVQTHTQPTHVTVQRQPVSVSSATATVRHAQSAGAGTVRHVMQQPTSVRPATIQHTATGQVMQVRQTGAATMRPGAVPHRPMSGINQQMAQSRTSTHTNQSMLENVKKCKNFLQTLIKLASSQPQNTVKNVKALIQGLIDGKVEPEDFTNKLQIELKSSPQPYLVPFLKKSLPLLRQSMMANKMQIDGVRAPPAAAAGSVDVTVGCGRSAAAGSRQAVSPQVTPKPGLPSQSHRQTLTPQQMLMYQTNQIRQQQAKNSAASGSSPHTKTLFHKPGTPVAGMSLQAKLAAQGKSPHYSHIASPGPLHKEVKRKYDSSLKEDDDINDVATMGGVNLSEESKNILGSAGDLVSGALRTCKDQNFLHTPPLLQRINRIVKKHGLEDCPQEVANLISHATEERLRTIVEKLGSIAEHRLEIYKMDNRYEQVNEIRSQLKFLEELDKLEKKRHDDAERETLLRVAKSRAKNEDPEQLKLKEKAKALQAAEMEQMRQQEANQTALAAIGPRKKRKIDDGGGSPGAGSMSAAASSSSTNARTSITRPRLKRVNLRDLIFLLEQEKECSKSNTLYRSYLK